MRVVLEVQSGFRAGHKLLLRPGDRLVVGRTEHADFATADNEMSSVHFQLDTDESSCQITDLDSTNGTFVNQESTKHRVLVDGDQILAGQIRFRVHIEGLAAAAVDAASAARTAPSVPTGAGAFAVSKCRSGLLCYVGEVAELSPARIVTILGANYPPTLIVDFNKASLSVPEGPAAPQYLFHWLAKDAQAKLSPVLLPPPDALAADVLIEQAWGQDALIVVFAEPDVEAPLEHLRQFAGVFARPSVLRPQLAACNPIATHSLLAGIQVVLVEDDLPERWVMFAPQDIESVLLKLGMTRRTPTAAVADGASYEGNVDSAHGNPQTQKKTENDHG